MAIGKTLTVYLAADISKLRSGLNSADRSLSGFGSKLTNMVGPALIGATAAAGAFAVALAVDGVQAAIKEEAELAKLSTTLKNLGFSQSSDEINTFIDDMQFATGVTDSELRPAFERLLISTGNVADAQKLLNIAVDTSIGANKSLSSVASSLGKALDGNFGALNKLGAGIDAGIIKSKDFDAATRALSDTFGGQAATNAATLGGQIGILKVAFDEAKESFGVGFLSAFQDSSGGVSDLSTALRDAQPQLIAIGKGVGDATLNLIQFVKYLGIAYEYTSRFDIKLGDTGETINLWTDGIIGMYSSLWKSTQAMGWFGQSAENAADGLFKFGVVASNPSRTSDAINRVTKAVTGMGDEVDDTTPKTSALSSTIEKMNPRLRAQIDLVKNLTTKVSDAGKALDTARQEMNAFISSMAGNITSGIDLGAAFDAMRFQTGEKMGELTGQSLLEGFNKQIAQAGVFGNYLKQLNSEGGPELRDAVAALGPETGSALAKEIIDQGLIPTLQSKLVDVQHMAETTAAELVPPMLVAGVASAAGYLMTMQAELEESSTLLEEMGRRMGKTLSEAMVAEIRAALAAAGVAQGGATSIMAGAPTPGMDQGQLIAGSPLLNGTAIMQAIQRAIADSDQRLGRTGQVVLQ